jgi:hypothetical protein
MAVKKHSSSRKDGHSFMRPKPPLGEYRDDTNLLVGTDFSFDSKLRASAFPHQSPDVSDDYVASRNTQRVGRQSAAGVGHCFLPLTGPRPLRLELH